MERMHNNLWSRKAEKTEIESMKKILSQQRMDTTLLKEIVADEIQQSPGSPQGTGRIGHKPATPAHFPGGYKRGSNSRSTGSFSAPSSPLASPGGAPSGTVRSLPDVGSPVGKQQGLRASWATGSPQELRFPLSSENSFSNDIDSRVGSPVPLAKEHAARGSVPANTKGNREARALPSMGWGA